MITDAAWMDTDGDKKEDLVLAGEWTPIRIFKNKTTSLEEITAKSGLASLSGMWRSITAADIDKDGDMDFVAGNIGLNNKYHFSSTYPLNLWYADLDDNGITDPLMGYYLPGAAGKKELFTAFGLDEIVGQVPSIKKSYLLHKDFSVTTMKDVFKSSEETIKLIANEAASCWFENNGTGGFTKHLLPLEAQFAPVNCILANDYNNDGFLDLLLAGNEYESEVMTGQYDASYGLLLFGHADKTFISVPQNKAGVFLRGDTRCLRSIEINKKAMVIAAINKGPLQVFQTNK